MFYNLLLQKTADSQNRKSLFDIISFNDICTIVAAQTLGTVVAVAAAVVAR